MRKTIFLALLLAAIWAKPALAQEVDFYTDGFVAQPVATQAAVGSISALTSEPSFLAPTQQWDSSSFLGTDTTINAPALDTATTNAAATDTATSFAGSPLQAASQGDQMHTSSPTGEGPQGDPAKTTSTTGKQNQGLNLPPCCYGIL